MTLKFRNLVFIALASGFIISCGEPAHKEESETPSKQEEKKADPNKTAIFQIGDEKFAIPSPVQTAALIQKTGAPYNKEILNDPKAFSRYSTKFQKAVNLGVYGADLGYITMYEQTQDGIMYIKAAEKIGEELGVTSAFSPELIKRFEANLGNRDSLLVLVSEAYKASDAFLKDNEREDVGGLIIAGGWLESLYFAASVYESTKNEEIKRRIGEQKTTLESIIKLLQRYSSNPDIEEFVSELTDLYYLYENVEITYEYVEPTHQPDKHLTIINSKSNVSVDDETLVEIIEKVKEIRNYLIE